jgi:sulfide:quinone oxidoreductase
MDAPFAALPQMPPRNVNWHRRSRWVNWEKIGFE